ncbi:MAG: chlorosome envelope protein B [Chlorobium phaeobacteroides]|uniref:Chlorosome envelope protein B n=1 Tax=Chlorobium phaeobacteroides (strain BS1) TaxID=331678 RepID=B3EL07_CHLPB|nr:chlorosome envelope protein B [Chlorobium phaeobacteroides]MBL6955306.1 chlorosome envelope protein B [Chlorobium phaeobacteroides]
MANESNNDLAGAISGLMETFTKLGQQQVEMLNNGIKSASEMAGPLGKTMTDLTGNVVDTVNQVLQNISSSISGGSK